MKMESEQYKILESQILSFVRSFAIEEIQNIRNNIQYTDSQYTAFIWKIYYLTNRNYNGSIGDELRKTLNDKHIETALKKILKDWK